MIVRKPSGIFWLDIRVNGRRIRRSLQTNERALALDRAGEISRELRAPKPAGLQIEEFCCKYLDWAREIKPASYRAEAYRVAVIKAWLYNAGLSTLGSITPYHVEQFRAGIRARDRRATKKTRPASAATANRYCALLRTMFNKARDWGEFHLENPVSKVRFFKEGGKVRPLSEAEIACVLDAARAVSADKHSSPTGRAIYDICRFILNTGLRRSEALSLRWADIIDDSLRIRGKGGKVRIVPLNGEALAILADRPRLTPFVFDVPNWDSPSVLRRVTEAISRKAKVRFHVHLLRHAFASQLLASGVDIVTVSDLLGHGAAMTTLLYTHSSEAQKRRAVDTLQGHWHISVNQKEAVSN